MEVLTDALLIALISAGVMAVAYGLWLRQQQRSITSTDAIRAYATQSTPQEIPAPKQEPIFHSLKSVLLALRDDSSATMSDRGQHLPFLETSPLTYNAGVEGVGTGRKPV